MNYLKVNKLFPLFPLLIIKIIIDIKCNFLLYIEGDYFNATCKSVSSYDETGTLCYLFP